MSRGVYGDYIQFDLDKLYLIPWKSFTEDVY